MKFNLFFTTFNYQRERSPSLANLDFPNLLLGNDYSYPSHWQLQLATNLKAI